MRKVAREMAWTVGTGFRSDAEFAWAIRPDFDFQDAEVHEQVPRDAVGWVLWRGVRLSHVPLGPRTGRAPCLPAPQKTRETPENDAKG
jgi:hypothetical protein